MLAASMGLDQMTGEFGLIALSFGGGLLIAAALFAFLEKQWRLPPDQWRSDNNAPTKTIDPVHQAKVEKVSSELAAIRKQSRQQDRDELQETKRRWEKISPDMP